MKNIKGIWFFGLSGSGKTYASKYLKKKKQKSFLIDGDEVRKNISTDLGYDQRSREKQISRIFGISKLVIANGFFPIISSVYMNIKMSKLLKKENIYLCFIKRNLIEIEKTHPTYTQNDTNIVGKDIKYEKFEFEILENKEVNFCKILDKLII